MKQLPEKAPETEMGSTMVLSERAANPEGQIVVAAARERCKSGRDGRKLDFSDVSLRSKTEYHSEWRKCEKVPFTERVRTAETSLKQLSMTRTLYSASVTSKQQQQQQQQQQDTKTYYKFFRNE
jgi:hypothetical protein